MKKFEMPEVQVIIFDEPICIDIVSNQTLLENGGDFTAQTPGVFV